MRGRDAVLDQGQLEKNSAMSGFSLASDADYFATALSFAGGFNSPPQDVPPSNRTFAGTVSAVGVRSGPNAGHAQLPKKAGAAP
jgi:hypothetical protein